MEDKNKLNTSLLQEGSFRVQSQWDQSKTKFQLCKSFHVQYLGLTHNLLDSFKGHFSGSALCNTHSLSSRLWLAPLHSCCWFWWSSHGTGISKMLGLLLQLSCTFTTWALFMVPSLNFSAWPFQFRAFNCYSDCAFTNDLSWPLPESSLSCSPWPLHAFKTSTTRVTLTLPHSFCVLTHRRHFQKISPQ